MKSIFTILITFIASLIISSALFAGQNLGLTFVGMVGVSVLAPQSMTGFAFETISPLQARGIYTDTMIAIFRERIPVMSFLRSFFPARTTMTKYVSIEVQRGTERVAVDVMRGTNGNRNKSTLSTMKTFLPPYFNEFFLANELDVYDRAIGSTDPQAMVDFSRESAQELAKLRDKIDRAVELMCAQIFEFGIITLVNGDNVDFKRKAASLVANVAGNTWATGTVSPYDTLKAGAKFLRETGKVMGANFNVILGATALDHFLSNTIVLTRNDIKNLTLDQISSPVKNAVGASYHGRVTAGAYTFDLWTYPEVYEDTNGDVQPYVNPKKVVILPETTNFELAYGLIPQLMNGGAPQTGQFLIKDFVDERAMAHEVHIMSAPIPIPVAIDQMYTVQVVA
jgi:hypothetical protein